MESLQTLRVSFICNFACGKFCLRGVKSKHDTPCVYADSCCRLYDPSTAANLSVLHEVDLFLSSLKNDIYITVQHENQGK